MVLHALRPIELRERLAAGESLVLLDVREPDEHALGVLPGSLLLPLSELSLRVGELDPDQPIVCICHHGVRSASVAQALDRLGFDAVYNLVGGLDRWSREVDPAFPRY
ncbi:MAG: hypothetical protein RIR65_552 [Planctomycetota bacterium]|jgi:adenylyltransferase/sulfurtransferase